MANAKKTKSGRWTISVYAGKDADGNRQYKRFTADSRKETEFLASQYAFEFREHHPKSKANLKFYDACDQYIESKSNVLSPSTIRGYRCMQEHAFPLLVGRTLANLAESDIVQRQINSNAVRYSSKTVHNQSGFVSTVLKHFRIRLEPITLPAKEFVKVPVPTETDAKKICVLLHDCPKIECQALLALTCSLRQSEIAALTAADVQGNDVFVHGARIPDKDSKLVYNPFGKSDAATRHVQMPEYLMQQVQGWIQRRPKGWLFPTKPNQVLYYFEKLERSHGMPAYTMHSLRHCFAAVMHALNVPDQYIMQLGGWKSDFVLKRVYRYALAEKTAEVKNKANEHFSNLLQITNRITDT